MKALINLSLYVSNKTLYKDTCLNHTVTKVGKLHYKRFRNHTIFPRIYPIA